MTTTTLPNLAGVIKTTDIYKKMKFDYVAWAKTAQILREHAPGWQFCLDKSTSEEGISSYIFQAPDGTGFLMGYFEHIDTSVKTTLFPFAITDNANRPLSKISSVNFQNSHRRCLCACACFTFGLAYELWAQIEIDEEIVGEKLVLMSENDEVILEMYNEKPIGIQLPKTLSFIVNETEAVVKGQTAASSNKPAILENGIRVMVPPFIEQGEKIEINTEDLSYSKRVD